MHLFSENTGHKLRAVQIFVPQAVLYCLLFNGGAREYGAGGPRRGPMGPGGQERVAK